MQKVLVLGAGLVAKPLVQYLLKNSYEVTVASRTVSKAEDLIEKHAHGKAQQLTVDMTAELNEAVKSHHLIISLLPYIHHLTIAKLCLKFSKHLITTSYVKPEMQALDAQAKAAGLLFLNEIGLDPGIDHMSAMKIIHEVQKAGGEVISFKSYCGGLPAPEDNNNPWGYKFSWSPTGVVMAAKNATKYLENGKEVSIPGEQLFEHIHLIDIIDVSKESRKFRFEAYGNRDSLPYIPLYGLQKAKTMFRGTLRNLGHCARWRNLGILGILDDKEKHALSGISPHLFLKKFICQQKEPKAYILDHPDLQNKKKFVEDLAWLGFFEESLLPIQSGSAMDVLCYLLQEKLQFAPGEKDMIVLHHEFETINKVGKHTQITSTLVDFGVVMLKPGVSSGASAMSRTVSLPAAVAAKLILEEKINLTGVHIPVLPEIYQPVLTELESMNIRCVERYH